MWAAERRVRALRLRAPDEARVRRGAVLLEDALRTATIPGAGGARLLVIRSLDVGAIRETESAAAVSVAIEERLRTLGSGAVHAAHPAAASAAAVFFHDDAEPLVVLARRVARGAAADEWFWPLVLPRVPCNVERGAVLRSLLVAALGTSGGAMVVTRLVAALAEEDGADALLQTLRPEDGVALLRACGWFPPRAETTPLAPSTSPTPVTPSASSAPALPAPPSFRALPALDIRAAVLVARWARAWGDRDARTIWLACVLLTARQPARLLDAELPDVAAALVREVRTTGAAPAGDPWQTTWATEEDWEIRRRARAVRQVEPGTPRPTPVRAASPPPSSRDSARNVPPAGRAPPVECEAVCESAFETPSAPPLWSTEPIPTPYAGLLFLVPLLARLGAVALLSARPELIERDWAARLFRLLARRLGVPPNDAALAALPFAPDAVAREDRKLAADWVRAMRRWCREWVGRSLRALVRRAGRVAWTPTHIDVLFAHRQAEIEVRRVGLDVNPGWVPWLGRVVSFHYLDPEDAGVA